jgi:4-cresol dehydrogenase (hydroxylating)
MAVLPPGVSAADFAAATKDFAAAIGADWVFTSEDDLLPYRDSFSTVWDTPEERRAGAAVAPASVEQVQAIVRIANRYRVPLFPISTGKNFGYGGPSPNVTGSVVVDLKRMNRVIELDDVRNFAIVEPGVSYFDLYRAIQERDLKLWVDCPDPGWGSPIGNSLERGIGYTMPFYRDHIGASMGLEAVLPNGEVMRTGMGALPGAKTWAEYRYGFGPDPAGLFAQGNFGIVTKMGFRLMPQPEHYRTGLITVPKRADFIDLVRICNYLSDSFLIGEAVYGSPLSALGNDAAFNAAANRPGGALDSEMDAIAASHNLPNWQVELQFYGPEATTRGTWDYAKDRFLSAIPGAKAYEGESLKLPLSDEQMLNTSAPYPTRIRRHGAMGRPSLGIWKIVGSNGHVGLFPVIPRTAEAVFEAQRVLGDAVDEFPGMRRFFNATTTPLHWHSFAFQLVFAPPIYRDDPAKNALTHRAIRKVTEVAAQHGWGDYRAAPIYQDAVADTYSFNNHVLRRFHETLKDAVDPAGILAPGRGGVWPRRFRRAR